MKREMSLSFYERLGSFLWWFIHHGDTHGISKKDVIDGLERMAFFLRNDQG